MKVLIIDDDHLVSQGIKTILEGEARRRKDDIVICATGSNGREAIELYDSHRPDLVLMDIRMPEMTGIEAGRIIMERDEQAKIIFLTTFLEDEYIIEALKIGAKGYIIKTDFAGIYPALEAVLKGQRIFGDQIVDRLPHALRKDSRIRDLTGLTEKENQLIYWVAQGLSNQEIAQQMSFSEGTIRNYISSLLEKLNLRNRTELAVYYYKNLQ
ncbi:MAG: response regulator transcription factor [Bacillota bacterium]|nr:response regulator transcription factor [Bacillota bacterium]